MIKISSDNFSTTNNGVFEGWGTSLCWWAHRVGYSSVLCEKSADLFFSKNGLALNIMRYNIGGGDDPSHRHIKRTDSAVPGWLYLDESGNKVWNYDADRNQLAVLQSACKVLGDDVYVEVFSNSPPYFMTKSGCSSGNVNPSDTNLKDDCVEEFANYLADVVYYMENTMKIKVKSLSAMNEPDTEYWKMNSEKQEGCHISPGKEQSSVILSARKALDERHLEHIIVCASDETSTERQINSYNLYSPKAKKAIGRISTHTYITDKINELGALCKKEGFNLWMSEVDGSMVAGENAGEMSAALGLSKKIISDINALSPSAWVLWLVIDYHKSKNGFNNNEDYCSYSETQGFWGLGHCDHDKKEFHLTQKYYAFGQFTKYIKKGMTLIHINEDNLAAIDKTSGEFVIVSLNCENRYKDVSFDISMFDVLENEARVITTCVVDDVRKRWFEEENAPIKDSVLSSKLYPNSVTTFIFKCKTKNNL